MSPSGSSSKSSKSSSSSSSKTPKPKASEVARETQKYWIPEIKRDCPHWKYYSYYYESPLLQISLAPVPPPIDPPTFHVYKGDPVDYAKWWSGSTEPRNPVAFICAANEKRAGGDWVTGVVGYEERLCRRSTLSTCLETPGPGSMSESSFPMSIGGGIFSEDVVVFRGGEDQRYEVLPTEHWHSLSVVSMPPVRWPKLNFNSGYLAYSFSNEREMMQNKIRGALAICAAAGIANIVVGDFGLGNGHRNPPAEMASFWADTVRYDPLLAGRIHHVAFLFEDKTQSTQRLIIEDMAKKQGKNGAPLSPALARAMKEKPVSDHDIFWYHFENRSA